MGFVPGFPTGCHSKYRFDGSCKSSLPNFTAFLFNQLATLRAGDARHQLFALYMRSWIGYL